MFCHRKGHCVYSRPFCKLAILPIVSRCFPPLFPLVAKRKHVDEHAGDQPDPGGAAAVNNGRPGEGGGGRNQPTVLGELGGAAPADLAEPEGKRSPEDEDEGDEE